MIEFSCPGCKSTFHLPDQLAGKTARCSKCSHRFTVPAGSGNGAMAAAASTAAGPKKVALNPVAEVMQSGAANRARGTKPIDEVEVVEVVDQVQVVDDVEVVDDAAIRERPPVRASGGSRGSRDDDDDDYGDIRRRKRRRAKSGSNTGLIVGLVVGGVFLIAVIGTVIFLLVRNSGAPAQPVIMAKFDQPNNPVQGNPVQGGNNQVILDRSDRLVITDPFDSLRPGHRAKRYTVQLEANRTYVIDMTATNRFADFDPYVRVEQNGVNLAEDDDGGNDLDAKLFFRPQQTGQYTIIATSFEPGETGSFRLTVRAQ